MKKAITTILCLLSLIILFSTACAFAEPDGAEYEYEINDDGTITITHANISNYLVNKHGAYYTDQYANVVWNIPETIDGYTVTAIGNNAFAYRDETGELKKIGDIYDVTFKVVIPDTVTSIGDMAFACSKISSITIPESVQHIGYGCFINCVKCEFLVAPDHPVFAVIDNALYHKGNKELLAYYVLKNRSIPEGIVSIGDYACYFVGDRDRIPFTKLTLPESLKRIGNYAFYNAAREMTLNDGLEWIGDYAFVNNSRINNTIPDNVEHIGIGCFQNLQWCDVVITSNSKLTEIPAYAFYGIRNKSPYVHIDAANITSIGDYAFAGQWNTNYDRAYNLVAMTNTQNITQIGEHVFSADGTYMDFEFSPEISTIPAGFYMTDPLPETITTIKAGAYGKVKDFVLPQSIELIENGAFVDGSTFIVSKGSYAESWVEENLFSYTYTEGDNLDWLN